MSEAQFFFMASKKFSFCSSLDCKFYNGKHIGKVQFFFSIHCFVHPVCNILPNIQMCNKYFYEWTQEWMDILCNSKVFRIFQVQKSANQAEVIKGKTTQFWGSKTYSINATWHYQNTFSAPCLKRILFFFSSPLLTNLKVKLR